MPRIVMIWVGAVLVWGVCAPAAAAPRADDPARLAPENALAFLGVAGIEHAWEEFTRSAEYRLMKDQDARQSSATMGFTVLLLEKLRERIGTLLKTDPEQLASPFRGALSLYVAAPPGAGRDELQLTLVAEVGDAALLRRYYDMLVVRLKENTGRYESEAAGSHTIDVFTTPPRPEGVDGAEEDEAYDPADELDALGLDPEAMSARVERELDKLFSLESLPARLALCFTGERLIAAPTADEVKAVLRRDRQDGATLADHEDYRRLDRRLGPVGRVRGYVNLRQVVQMISEDARDDPAQRDQMQALGLNSLRCLIGHLGYDPERRRWRGESQLVTTAERSGLSALLALENRPAAPPPGITADTCYFISLNASPPKLLDEIEKMVRQSDPIAADRLRASWSDGQSPAGEPLNLRADLIDHLRGPLMIRLAFPRPYKLETARWLLSCGQRDRAALNRVFGQFAGLLSPRDARGTQLFDLPFLQVSLAAATDELLIGPAHALEAALERGAAESLADTAAFRRLAADLPAESWLTAYADERQLTEALLDTAAAGADETAAGLSVTGLLLDALRVQLLGPGELEPEKRRRLLRYAGQSLLTIRTVEDGLHLSYIQQGPEE